MLIGCQGPQQTQRSFRVHDNIANVHRFFNKQAPWVNFKTPPTAEPQGMKITVYLSVPGKDMGVYGDGVILADLYEVIKQPEGEPLQNHLKNWAFDPDQAAVFHGDRSRMGQPYFLILDWPELNLAGKEILIALSFKRKDGRLVKARPVRTKVPRPR